MLYLWGVMTPTTVHGHLRFFQLTAWRVWPYWVLPVILRRQWNWQLFSYSITTIIVSHFKIKSRKCVHIFILLTALLPRDKKICPRRTREHEVNRFKSSAFAIFKVSRRYRLKFITNSMWYSRKTVQPLVFLFISIFFSHLDNENSLT